MTEVSVKSPDETRKTKVRQRAGVRSSVTTIIKGVQPMLQRQADPDPPALRAAYKKLQHNFNRLYELDAEVLDLTAEQAVDDEVSQTQQYNDGVLTAMVQIEECLTPPDPSQVASSTSPGHSGDASSSLRLPKFEMAKFAGDPLQYQSFSDVYKAAIHDNKKLNNVEKFTYLLGYLEGEPLTMISGFALTADNYQHAFATIEERYGNKQRAQSAHFLALIGLEPAKSRSLAEVRRVFDQCEVHIRSLVALGLAEDTFAVVFTSLILSKLPDYLSTKLMEKTGRDDWSLSKFREWIGDDIRAREIGETNGSRSNPTQGFQKKFVSQQPSPTKAITSTSALAAPGGRTPRSGGKPCALCGKTGHWPKVCRSYPTVDDRISRLKEIRGCFNCLKEGHRSSECEYAGRKCTVCGKTGHHIILCRTQESGSSSSSGRSWANTPTKSQSNRGKSENPEIEAHATPRKTDVNVTVAEGVDEQVDVAFLQTAVVKVKNCLRGGSVEARLLMDTASSRTYITETLRERLRLETVGRTHVSVGRFGTAKRVTKVVEKVKFDVVCLNGSSQPVLAIVVPVITCPIAYTPVDLKVCPAARNLKLAEPLKASSENLELDVLVGSDQYYNFVHLSGSIADECGLVFINSRLGYLTAGTMPIEHRDARENPESSLALLRPDVEREFSSHECDIERFWQVEEVGAVEKKDSVSDEEALLRFQDTVQYHDGRYYVTWPWKSQEPELANNYGLAFGRLKSTLSRLKQDTALMSDYNDIIMKQAEKGYIEKVVDKPERLVYYLPHHPVFKPESRTTKIRIVYDASSKARKDLASLNDCIHQGPVILDDLIGLLIRFRTHRIALVSDIEKAFWQIRLQKSERDVTRFLWVNDVNKPPTGKNLVHWRFTSVFFGAISSPFLLGATINHHLRQAGGDVASKITQNLYVDNVITGENDEDSATNHYREAKSLFLGASMNLREFFTNSATVREKIAPEDRGKADEPKVLGVVWNVERDTLRGAMKYSQNGKVPKVTKRVVAQQTAELWDPCGWYAPVVLTGKLLYQQVWKLGLDWNAPVPEEIVKRLAKIRKEYLAATELGFDRYLGELQGAQLQLHTFCDSSKLASGVVVYLRVEQKNSVTSHLLLGKTRLASVKPSALQTIPRLELIALVMGVLAMEFVSEQLRLPINKKTVWSDSHCVLYWLTKDKLATKFVERRVKMIRAKKDVDYRYVPSEDNPADLASRGCSARELTDSALWWNGPSWLVQSDDYWPINIPERAEPEPEKHTEEVLQLATAEVARPSGILDIQRYSSLNRLLRVTAYVIRFGQNLRLPEERQFGVLSVHEISKARLYWERLCQAQGFPELQGKLSSKALKKSPVRQLNVFRDDQGLLRSAGRLTHASVSFDVKNPVLLPKNHPFTSLAVRNAHVVMGHAGVAQTLAELRQRYWVLHGRSQVKKVVRNCTRCRRIEGGPYKIPAAPALPDFRVKEDVPFTSTGLDYLGFLHVKTIPGEIVKVWVCLFTCASSRAVHLELVENQSAEEFHLALRRFFALYGCPKLIVSDNASQFVSVQTAMTRLWSQLVTSSESGDIMTTHNVEWKKIPEVAPWMGGFYERLVGMVKKFLKKMLDGVCVSMSEMRTVLAEITVIVNSRPLLYVEDDVSSTPLCPLDLLGRSRRSQLPTFDASGGDQAEAKTTPEKVVASWKRLQVLTSTFWSHWRDAYLTSLREKHANAAQRNSSELLPSVDSVVQVKDKLPRAQWRLGKVVQLFPSADGKVRSVQLRIANGRLITRPIKLLYPLEMHIESCENSLKNQNPFSVPIQSIDNDDESDFEGFSSQDIAQTERDLEKYDEFEKAITAKNKPNPGPLCQRPQRQKALAAREKIRQAIIGGSSPNFSWWESSEESE